MIADGPACESRSSLTHGASNPAEPAGMEMPPMAHWSIGRPQGAPTGLQVIVSLAKIGVAEPRSTPPTPPTGGTGAGSVPPGPLTGGAGAEGAELVSVPPAPKYRRVGSARVNGYLAVWSNCPLPRS